LFTPAEEVLAEREAAERNRCRFGVFNWSALGGGW
jgi:hypothetical protein